VEGAGGSSVLSTQRLARRNVRFLQLDMGWQGLITAGILTFISVFLVRLGASAFLLSLLTSLPALITIVLSVLLVPVVERQANQVRLVTLTRLATRGCYLLIALAPFVLVGTAQRWLPLVAILLWGLSAVFGAATNTAFIFVLSEVVPPRQRPNVNGVRWAVHSLVTAISVAIFGRLLDSIATNDELARV
jgi:cyanate permease